MKDIGNHINIIEACLVLLGEYELSGGAVGQDSMVKGLKEWQTLRERIDNIKRGVGDMYELKKHHCDCHPATCNCDPWVIEKDGKPFIPIYFYDRGELIVKALNHYPTKWGE